MQRVNCPKKKQCLEGGSIKKGNKKGVILDRWSEHPVHVAKFKSVLHNTVSYEEEEQGQHPSGRFTPEN